MPRLKSHENLTVTADHENLTVTAGLLAGAPWYACSELERYTFPIELSTNPEDNIDVALMLVARREGCRAWWFTRRAGNGRVDYPDSDYAKIPEADPYVVAQVLAWGADLCLSAGNRRK